MVASVAVCNFVYQLDPKQLLAIARTIALVIEAGVLVFQRSWRGGGIRAWRSRPVAPLALAALASALLTAWLIGQGVYYIYNIAPQAFCGGRYDPQAIVPAFDAVLNAQALAAATLGAILAIFGLGTLFALVSLLTHRARPQATRPTAS